ncbi:MAG: hypothetical protein ABJA81_03420 [Nocardioidaceae bacterium]
MGSTARTRGSAPALLNAMQQVGGSLGLATLSTDAVHVAIGKADQIFAASNAFAAAHPGVSFTQAQQAAFQKSSQWGGLHTWLHPRVHRGSRDDLGRCRERVPCS